MFAPHLHSTSVAKCTQPAITVSASKNAGTLVVWELLNTSDALYWIQPLYGVSYNLVKAKYFFQVLLLNASPHRIKIALQHKILYAFRRTSSSFTFKYPPNISPKLKNKIQKQ